MTKKQLKQLKTHIQKTGGATINIHGRLRAFKNGYMVSKDGFAKITTLKRLNRRLIRTYTMHALLIGAYVGFWIDNGLLYIDLSMNILDKQRAIYEGLINNQIAIYDCKNKQSIYLK